MEVTLEQKAFRDFGMALGELKRARKEIVYNLEYYRGLKRNEAIFVFRKRLCERNKLIRDAWQKRAVCRRTCSECQTYQRELKDSYKNIWCPYAEIYTNGKARCVGCPFFEQMKGGE